MLYKDVKTWEELRFHLDELWSFGSGRDAIDRIWFRGQSRYDHELVPSVDRSAKFASTSERSRYISKILDEFRNEAILLGSGSGVPSGVGLELLARHHGLPSPLLDWTLSPYVAAFFAFFDAVQTEIVDVSIYALYRPYIPKEVLEPEGPIGLIYENEYLQFNRRACQQRGVFLRLSSAERTIEECLQDSLVKFRIPASERRRALSCLDSMLLNSSTLMYDLDGAAKTAIFRHA